MHLQFKKIYLLVFLLLLALTPAFFYLRWFFAAEKFKSSLLKTINSYTTFSYKHCKKTGFWSGDLNVEFTDPVFYINTGSQKMITRFNKINFLTDFKTESIKIKPSNGLSFNLQGTGFDCQNVQDAFLDFASGNNNGFAFTANNSGINCTGDKKSFAGNIDIKVENFLSSNLNKFMHIVLRVNNSEKSFIDCDFKISWDKKNLAPLYLLDIKKAEFDSDNSKIKFFGNPKISFTNRPALIGKVKVLITDYQFFFESILNQKNTENLVQISAILDYLKENSQIKDDNIEMIFIGDGENISLGNSNLFDALAKIFEL